VVHVCLTAGKLNATAKRKANGKRKRRKADKILPEIKPVAPFIQEINCLLQFMLA